MKSKRSVFFGVTAALLMSSDCAGPPWISRVLRHQQNGHMEGTVTEFQWRNPHVYILYDVKDAQGNVVTWGAETHSPVVCEDQDGWTKSTLKPGDKITISVFPSKINTPRGLLAKIVSNGKAIIDDTGRGRQPGQ